MPAPKIYKTKQAKQEARKKLNSKYYAQNQDNINKRRRDKYRQCLSEERPDLYHRLLQWEEKRSAFRLVEEQSGRPPTPPNTPSPVESPLQLQRPLLVTQASVEPPLPLQSPIAIVEASVEPPLQFPSSPIADAKSIPPRVKKYHHVTHKPQLLPPPKMALKAVEAIFDRYVEKIGGNWNNFFHSLVWSFIDSDSATGLEIEEQYEERLSWVADIRQCMKALEASAERAGDQISLELGWGMVERMSEIVQKLNELSHAILLGSEGLREVVLEGTFTW
ncbi:hypothetical protein GYMLUDRAFT_249299 [Collybiopsis luxurians FD-317 M1]|uniref:Uncharacterized protein n=1 Tax=Collybiopsis luxurians FD-317 M1 TaxID=944289 RepID=A0A0D0BJ52_9AGAR|nr:hypothetical protein GYMLUDRAFT_249299 [Collybiopsis luxurians FD-317 M1]